jgi:DNA-binding response OmpR family regulator
MTGFDVLRTYRAAGGQAPVIILTGQAELDSKLTGLDLGAEDYLTKPFHVLELGARIRGLLRRPRQTVSTVYQCGALTLDADQHQLKKNGTEIKLKPKDFALLEFFMSHPEQVFSIESLLTRVWTYEDNATADGLRTAITRIRKSIDDVDDLDGSYIENIARVGYRLRAPKV